jgi:alpha-beta hydrolase superfamily lysophospholipase
MRAIHDLAPGQDAERILLVMLPAAKARPEDLLEQGFVAAVRDRGLPLDVAVMDAQPDYYLEGRVGERLAADVFGPLRARGYRRIWLMGMSLGGMGCIAYAHRHAAEVEGVILLAPFLGARGLIAQILRAGGLARWQPAAPAPDDEELALLLWLKRYRADNPQLPAIHLGCGRDDRYAPASAMLAQQLPAERVVSVPGKHDWQTWIRLWRALLAKNLFLVEA